MFGFKQGHDIYIILKMNFITGKKALNKFSMNPFQAGNVGRIAYNLSSLLPGNRQGNSYLVSRFVKIHFLDHTLNIVENLISTVEPAG
ncbi:hypothetical protein D3C86_1916100 [compost metagenome]